MKRTTFATRLGLILATAGSAVGLGNIWRFSYVTGENGGAAFILIYIACVLVLGIPCMIGEFVVGRSRRANAPRAYATMPGAHRSWGIVGIMGMITAGIILGFYSVVAGWCLYYLWSAICGNISGDAAAATADFQAFATNGWLPVVFALLFLLATHAVVSFGVKRGIERASRVLMPMLLMLLVVLIVASCSLPGSGEGIKYLFHPDWSVITPTTLLEALGQAFFSLSLGVACLSTYASYFDRKVNLITAASQIAILDTVIAVLAGLMIFPAAFAVGVKPDSGPSLIFETLPVVFESAFGSVPGLAWVVSIMFYALVVLAALTSTISMHEIGTAFCSEEGKMSRGRAAWIVTGACASIAVFCALSGMALPDLTIGGKDALTFFDNFTGDYLMPLGALLTCTLLGWFVPSRVVREELTDNHPAMARVLPVLMVALRFVCPACIVLIMLHRFAVI